MIRIKKTILKKDGIVNIPDSWWSKCPFLHTLDKIVFVGYDNPKKSVVIRKKDF